MLLSSNVWQSVPKLSISDTNLCLVITKKQLSAYGKSWDKPLAIFGIPYGFVYRPSDRESATLFRLGDQMAVIPSLCGDGMDIALHTGFMAADFYLKADAHAYHNNAYRQLSP
jgi:hypothetical protein